MKLFEKVLLFNFLIMIAYSALMRLHPNGNHPLGKLAFFFIGIAFQIAINIILAITFLILKKNEQSEAYFISIGLLLVVGIPACYGNAFI